MSRSDLARLESRLPQELELEVRRAMVATDTHRELERFRTATVRRAARVRVLTAAAAVVCICAAAVGVIGVVHASSPTTTPVSMHPGPSVTPHRIVRNQRGAITRLPAGTSVTRLKGPQNLGTLAFGDLWATTGTHGVHLLPKATLYRISADGGRVLSTTHYPEVNDNQPDPVQIGNAIVVADRHGGYTVVDPTGRRIGTLASSSTLGAATGDPSGGWIATATNQVARVDASGLRILRRLTLPVQDISSLATSPGALWVADFAADQIVRVNPTTGAVTGRTQLDFAPTQVRYINGAAYVATGADLGIHRIDPSTMELTGTALGTAVQDASPRILPAAAGQVWTQAVGGTLSELDPLTLRTEHTTRVFPELDYITNGAVIGTDRIYVVDGEARRLYTYPTSGPS